MSGGMLFVPGFGLVQFTPEDEVEMAAVIAKMQAGEEVCASDLREAGAQRRVLEHFDLENAKGK